MASSFGISRPSNGYLHHVAYTPTVNVHDVGASTRSSSSYSNTTGSAAYSNSTPTASMCGMKECGGNGRSITLVCFTPRIVDGVVSCMTKRGLDRTDVTSNENLAIVPANAVIERVEFYGYSQFSTKESFSIGLGQLNQGMSIPLIEDAVAETANERNGGRRYFWAGRPDGRNECMLVLCDANVNVLFNQPLSSGGLAICITYHVKPSLGKM